MYVLQYYLLTCANSVYELYISKCKKLLNNYYMDYETNSTMWPKLFSRGIISEAVGGGNCK